MQSSIADIEQGDAQPSLGTQLDLRRRLQRNGFLRQGGQVGIPPP